MASLTIGCLTTTAPTADSNTYPIFNSVSLFGGGLMRVRKLSRLTFNLKNSHAGTLKSYRSIDKGTTWVQFGGDIVVTASGATDVSGPYDFLVDTYSDVKLDWVNGGSAQTTWSPELTAVCGDRASGT